MAVLVSGLGKPVDEEDGAVFVLCVGITGQGGSVSIPRVGFNVAVRWNMDVVDPKRVWG